MLIKIIKLFGSLVGKKGKINILFPGAIWTKIGKKIVGAINQFDQLNIGHVPVIWGRLLLKVKNAKLIPFSA